MTALHLYQPRDDRGDGDPSADWTLSQLVDRYYLPVTLLSRDARPRNVAEVLQSVKYWQRFTQDPPLREASAYHCRDFVVGLKSLPGRRQAAMANNTVRKHCGAIQAIFDLCGPPDRKHRDALGILTRPPYLQRPRKQTKPAEDFLTVAELELLLANCELATLPKGLPCSAPQYHRRLYVLIFNTGLRIGSVMQMCWSHYYGDHLLLPPGAAIKGSDFKRIELNDAAQRTIESMRGCDAERIFPWPLQWPDSKSSLFDQHAIIRGCLPPERQFGYHGIRKLYNNQLAGINAAACQKALGHASGRTTIEHYTSRTIVAEANAQLPPLRWAAERQPRLFD